MSNQSLNNSQCVSSSVVIFDTVDTVYIVDTVDIVDIVDIDHTIY